VSVPRRPALAAVGSALLAYVGVVHEVVGPRLYPDGPARFGGPLPWHAAGLLLVVLGLLMLSATLGLVRAPVVSLGAVLGAVGAVFVALQAGLDGGFHFFAFTMLVAGALVAATGRRTEAS
jgi:hypothetical protein